MKRRVNGNTDLRVLVQTDFTGLRIIVVSLMK